MPYFVCDNCDIYYKVHSKAEIAELGCCDNCGNFLKYHDSLEEYLHKKNKIKEPPKDNELLNQLIDSYESAISKIILYCVSELPFPLGTKKVIGVLKGSKSSFMIDYEMNKLSTYSMLSNFSNKNLETFIKALTKEEMLKINYVFKYQNMPTLALTEEGLKSISNKEIIKIDIFHKKTVNHTIEFNEDLYRQLRDLRKQIAKENEIPAFIVCHNEHLMEMASHMPVDHDSMISIKGIGKKFMEKYGKQFIDIIQEYKPH